MANLYNNRVSSWPGITICKKMVSEQYVHPNVQFSSRQEKEIIVSKEGVSGVGFVSNNPWRRVEPANEEEMKTRIKEI